MAELGETNDPRQLVPGDPAAVSTTAKALRTRADALEQAGVGLQRIDTTSGWSGPAGEAFRARFTGLPGDWLQAAASFNVTADALDNYSTTLHWAQHQAARAVTEWKTAQGATERGRALYQQYLQHGGTGPFEDPGDPGRASARSLLGTARSDLTDAGAEVAKVIGAERDKAPTKPSFWSKVKGFASDVGAAFENTGAKVVDTLASTGNAMIHHPGDVALAAAGVLLTDVSAGGEVLGVGLDLTGGGAIVGGPLNAVSALGIAVGASMAGGAAADLAMHARGDDAVSPASADHPGSTSAGSGITGDGGEMIGSKGTRIYSSTLWRKGTYRIDVENPNPGRRAGQIHFQDKAAKVKYIYNLETGEFDGMPNSLRKELAKKFPDYVRAIAKGKAALGE